MKRTKRASAGIAILGSALVVALTGCVTYVQPPPPAEVYVPPPPPPQPPVVVIQHEVDFYEPLNPHGSWVVVESYGRCWRPARVEADWRPYSNGHWVRTDAGWYWATDEPWGWATYHYGRWDWTPAYGWIWVPQTQWAPAWVTWRQGAGYVGWAPLPPSARFEADVVVVRETAHAPRAFVFVEERRLLEPVRPKTVIVNNTTIINKTVNITKIKVVNKTVVNEGPRPEVIERISAHKVQSVPIHELRRKDETEVVARQPQVRASLAKRVPPTAPTATAPAPEAPAKVQPPAATAPASRPGQRATRERSITNAPQVPTAQKPVATPAPKQQATPPKTVPSRDIPRKQVESAKVPSPVVTNAPGRGVAKGRPGFARPEAKPEQPIQPGDTRPVAKPVEAPKQTEPVAKEAQTPAPPAIATPPVRPEVAQPPLTEQQRGLGGGKGVAPSQRPGFARQPSPVPAPKQAEAQTNVVKGKPVKGKATKKKTGEQQEPVQPTPPAQQP